MSIKLSAFLAVLIVLVSDAWSAKLTGVEEVVSSVLQPEGRATVTATLLVTTTISSVTTTVLTTKKICASLSNAASTAACRRKRQYWNAPIYIGFQSEDDGQHYQYRLKPSEVLRFEPTMLPQFRRAPVQSSKPAPSPHVVESSFDKTQDNLRVAQPLNFSALSSIISSIAASLLTPVTTVTSTVTSYTSTSTSTTYTATTSYTLSATCVPAGVTTC